MTSDDIKAAVSEGVSKGIKEAMEQSTRDFYIGREEHFKHHEALRLVFRLLSHAEKPFFGLIWKGLIFLMLAAIFVAMMGGFTSSLEAMLHYLRGIK